jgi:cytochrome c553
MGCSVNQLSKDYYDYKKELRHGLIPVARKKPAEREEKIPFPINFKQAELGRNVYLKHCAMCHGDDARGNGPKAGNFFPRPRDLVKTVKEVPNFKFYLAVSEWQKTMPGWNEPLTEDEILYIEMYLKSLSNKDES